MDNNSFGNDTVIEILELHPYEVELVHSLRNRFRFGEITILMHDGLPVRWKRITEFGEPKRKIDKTKK